MQGAIPLHAQAVSGGSLAVIALVALGTLGAAVLLGLAIAAFIRRRSGSHLLVAGAVAALLARSVVAGAWTVAAVSPATHHRLEHALDVALVALVIAAVYTARSAPPEVDTPP